jgi:nitroreductase
MVQHCTTYNELISLTSSSKNSPQRVDESRSRDVDYTKTSDTTIITMPQPIANFISSRHSTRAFLPTPIPRSLLENIFITAQQSPSNSNLQPWRIKVITGPALHRLTSALLSVVSSDLPPTTAPIPESYRHYRSALGKQLYGPNGYDIPRSDTQRKRVAENRNYTFFDAPCALIVCIDRSLAQVDVVSVGMYVQTLCLLLAEQGGLFAGYSTGAWIGGGCGRVGGSGCRT